MVTGALLARNGRNSASKPLAALPMLNGQPKGKQKSQIWLKLLICFKQKTKNCGPSGLYDFANTFCLVKGNYALHCRLRLVGEKSNSNPFDV